MRSAILLVVMILLVVIPVIAQIDQTEIERLQEQIKEQKAELERVKKETGITPGMSNEDVLRQMIKNSPTNSPLHEALKNGDLLKGLEKQASIILLQTQLKGIRRRLKEEEGKTYDKAQEKKDLENYIHGKEEIIKNHDLQISRTQAKQRLYAHWREKYKDQKKPTVGPYTGVKVSDKDFKIAPKYEQMIKETIIRLYAITTAGRVVPLERLDKAEQEVMDQLKRNQEAKKKLQQEIQEEKIALQQGKFTERERLLRAEQRVIKELQRLGGKIPPAAQVARASAARPPARPQRPPAAVQQPAAKKPPQQSAKKPGKPKKKPKIKWWKIEKDGKIHAYACSLPCMSREVGPTGKVTLVSFEKKYKLEKVPVGGYI